MRWAYQRLKTNREENLTKHVRVGICIFRKTKKKEKLMMKKVATTRKSKAQNQQ